jgi:hypothetical protein
MSHPSPTQFHFRIDILDRIRKLLRLAPPSKFETNYLASLSVTPVTRRPLLALRESRFDPSRITDHSTRARARAADSHSCRISGYPDPKHTHTHTHRCDRPPPLLKSHTLTPLTHAAASQTSSATTQPRSQAASVNPSRVPTSPRRHSPTAPSTQQRTPATPRLSEAVHCFASCAPHAAQWAGHPAVRQTRCAKASSPSG